MAGLSNNQIVALAVAVVIGGMGLATAFPQLVAGPAPAATPAPEKLQPAQVAKCREVLKLAMDGGIIRARPKPTRIDVDEMLWAQADARTKDLTLHAVACDVWGLATPPPGEFVVSYGWRSGRRIEMLSELGVTRD